MDRAVREAELEEGEELSDDEEEEDEEEQLAEIIQEEFPEGMDVNK